MGERSFFISTCILVGPGQGAVWKLPHREVDESYPGEYWMFEDPCKDELAWTLSQRFQHVFAVNSRAGVNLVSGRVKVVPFLLGPQFANFGSYPQIEDRKNDNMSSKLHGPRVHLA